MSKQTVTVLDSRPGKFRSMPVIGSYGMSDAPVVECDGEEYVTELCYVKPSTGTIVGSVCRSGGCDWCDGSGLGCRYREENDACEQVLVI